MLIQERDEKIEAIYGKYISGLITHEQFIEETYSFLAYYGEEKRAEIVSKFIIGKLKGMMGYTKQPNEPNEPDPREALITELEAIYKEEAGLKLEMVKMLPSIDALNNMLKKSKQRLDMLKDAYQLAEILGRVSKL